jgi:intracellular septation protein
MPARAILHLVTEFVPVVAFFLAGNFLSLTAATYVLIITTVAALTIGLWCAGRMPILPVVSTIFVLVSGGISLRTHEVEALIIADSLYYFLLAGVVALGLSFRFNVLRFFFDHTFAMTKEGWDVLALRWVAIFILAGAANEFVRIALSPEAWFDFRFIKVLAITGFGVWQLFTARRYRIPETSNHWGLRIRD